VNPRSQIPSPKSQVRSNFLGFGIWLLGFGIYPESLIYFLFFCSGVSGLIYQVVWVRVFGNVFGNTVYSASIVVAIFMLGLGAGSLAIGAWADRRYAQAPDSLLRAYGGVELLIAALGCGVSLALPRLGALSASGSSYAVD